MALTRATRETPLLRLGASPRASLALLHAAQAAAALAGRDFVTPDDVQHLVEPVLAHRLLLAPRRRRRRPRPPPTCCARSSPPSRCRPRAGRRPATTRGEDGDPRPADPVGAVRLRSILWACLAGLVAGRPAALRALVFATLAASALAALVVSRAGACSRPSPSSARRPRRVVDWGGELEVTMSVTNAKLLPLVWMRVRDEWPAGLEPSGLRPATRRASRQPGVRRRPSRCAGTSACAATTGCAAAARCCTASGRSSSRPATPSASPASSSASRRASEIVVLPKVLDVPGFEQLARAAADGGDGRALAGSRSRRRCAASAPYRPGDSDARRSTGAPRRARASCRPTSSTRRRSPRCGCCSTCGPRRTPGRASTPSSWSSSAW